MRTAAVSTRRAWSPLCAACRVAVPRRTTAASPCPRPQGRYSSWWAPPTRRPSPTPTRTCSCSCTRPTAATAASSCRSTRRSRASSPRTRTWSWRRSMRARTTSQAWSRRASRPSSSTRRPTRRASSTTARATSTTSSSSWPTCERGASTSAACRTSSNQTRTPRWSSEEITRRYRAPLERCAAVLLCAGWPDGAASDGTAGSRGRGPAAARGSPLKKSKLATEDDI
mmetsp:Transcript_27558/g.65673  ORF Transcript_27558/g.65673 Transcript_27558/m.65673 type:complete len:227 (+) Transcript_27558:976-1656(+)